MNHLITTELKQQQTISPQVYQSLKILQMNSIQLDEYIKDAVLENPVLEQDENAPYSSGLQSLDSMRQPLTWTWEEGAGWQEDDRPAREFAAPDTGDSLREHLASQYNSDLSADELRLLDGIVDYLDETGYLTGTDAEISETSGFSEELVSYGVAYLQTLDPLGVCARSLTQCLCIQLDMLDYRDPTLRIMVESHLEDIAAGRYNKIAKKVGRSPQEVRRLCAIVKSLHPKPGACFGGVPAAPSIPDVIVTVEDGAVHAAVNDRGNDRVGINSYYARLARQDEYGEAAAYLAEKLAQARWIIKAVESRRSTLQAIAHGIARYQSEFFLRPEGTLRPLNLKRMAAELELHESTVSRAISGKYLQCKRGTFPLKYFFASGVGAGEDGKATSRNSIKTRIAQLIAAEDKRHPLSDSALTNILAAEGISLSRRVIAKYRSELCIPSTSVRRGG